MKLDQVHKTLIEAIGVNRAKHIWDDCYDLAETVHSDPTLIMSFTNSLYRRCAKELLRHHNQENEQAK